MKFTPEMRTRMIEDSKGKVIESLDYDDEENYWVMTFTDGSEMCFRFIAELV